MGRTSRRAAAAPISGDDLLVKALRRVFEDTTGKAIRPPSDRTDKLDGEPQATPRDHQTRSGKIQENP